MCFVVSFFSVVPTLLSLGEKRRERRRFSSPLFRSSPGGKNLQNKRWVRLGNYPGSEVIYKGVRNERRGEDEGGAQEHQRTEKGERGKTRVSQQSARDSLYG